MKFSVKNKSAFSAKEEKKKIGEMAGRSVQKTKAQKCNINVVYFSQCPSPIDGI